MQPAQFVAADLLCKYHNIELSFITSLQEYGLIEVNTIEEKRFIPDENLQELEQFIHLHYDLDINVEGIDAIAHLLEHIKAMQAEIALLKNRLRMYEE